MKKIKKQKSKAAYSHVLDEGELSEKVKNLFDCFILDSSINGEIFDNYVNELRVFFKKNKFYYLPQIVTYLNSVKDEGVVMYHEDDVQKTRFGCLFDDAKKCQIFLNLFLKEEAGVVGQAHKNKNLEKINYFFNHVELDNRKIRLIDIIESSAYNPRDYKSSQNAAIFWSLGGEIKEKIKESMIGTQDGGDFKDIKTSSLRSGDLNARPKNRVLSDKFLKNIESYWYEQISLNPGVDELKKARAELCEKYQFTDQLLKNSVSQEEKHKHLQELGVEIMAVLFAPSLMPYLDTYSELYLNSSIFEMQHFSTKEQIQILQGVASHNQFNSELREFLISALSSNSHALDRAANSMNNQDLGSIALLYPLLQDSARIIQANAALKEKDMLSHFMVNTQLLPTISGRNKI